MGVKASILQLVELGSILLPSLTKLITVITVFLLTFNIIGIV